MPKSAKPIDSTNLSTHQERDFK